MKNKRLEFGNIKVKVPELVIKLGFVLDTYKEPHLKNLWKDAEKKSLKQMPTFKKDELFYEEISRDPIKKLTYSFRYYTPESNRIETGNGPINLV